MTPKFFGKIEQGQLKISNPTRFRQYLNKFEGKEIELIVDRKKKIRSLKSNNLYWAYLNIIEEETGEEANNLHEYFKRIFLQPQIIVVLGKEIKIPASTTKLTPYEFTTYFDKISALTGVPVPNPDDYYRIEN